MCACVCVRYLCVCVHVCMYVLCYLCAVRHLCVCSDCFNLTPSHEAATLRCPGLPCSPLCCSSRPSFTLLSQHSALYPPPTILSSRLSLTFLSFSPSLSLVIFLNGFWRKIYACLLQFSSKSMHVCMCQCVFACLCMCVCTCVCVRVCAPVSALCQ